MRFLKASYSLTPSDSLTVGRSAPLLIDTNRHLLGVMESFFHASGHRWVRIGRSSIPLHQAEGTIATGPDSVPLTDDQRLASVVLAEDSLGSPDLRISVSSNVVSARRIGWTLNRFNRADHSHAAGFGSCQ